MKFSLTNDYRLNSQVERPIALFLKNFNFRITGLAYQCTSFIFLQHFCCHNYEYGVIIVRVLHHMLLPL